jgi:hypothetical protein
MSAQQHLAPDDQSARDLYAKDRALNSAIIASDISRGWEKCHEMFDALCAGDVKVTTNTETGTNRSSLSLNSAYQADRLTPAASSSARRLVSANPCCQKTDNAFARTPFRVKFLGFTLILL